MFCWRYFFCITKKKLCFYVRNPLGSTKYTEVHLEDVITSQVSKPSLFYATVAAMITALRDPRDIKDAVESSTPIVKYYGLFSSELVWYLSGYVAANILTVVFIYGMLYMIFVRPMFTVQAVGGRILITTSAESKRANALRMIIREVYRLRDRIRRFDAVDLVHDR